MERIVVNEPIVSEFKKFLGACGKLTKVSEITLNNDGFMMNCGTDFNIKGLAPPQKFNQFMLDKEHKICNIIIDDIHDLITRKTNRLEFLPEDEKVRVKFFSSWADKPDIEAELGGKC